MILPLVGAYVTSLVAFAVIDFVWIGVLMKQFYFSKLGHLFATDFNLYAGVAFYLVYTAGIFYFAVVPAGSIWRAVMLGALLGALAYATYDLTNMTTLKDWPLSITLLDILWGAALSGMVSAVGYGVLGFFNK